MEMHTFLLDLTASELLCKYEELQVSCCFFVSVTHIL